MKYDVYKYSNDKEVTKYIENKNRKNLISNICSFNWSDDITTMTTSFNFETNEDLSVGNFIELYDYIKKESIFWGKIEKITKTEKDLYKYEGFDYGYELKKKPVDIQFNGKPVQDAIQDVCSKNNIDIGSIDLKETVYIKKSYRNINTVSDILEDIHIKTLDGKIENDYYFSCKDRKLNLLRFPYVEEIYGYNGRRMNIYSFDYILKFDKTITANINLDNKDYKIDEEITNDNNSEDVTSNNSTNKIKEYFDRINQEAKRRREQEENEKRRLAESLEDVALTVYADSQLCVGVKTNIYNKQIGLDGLYLITSSNHRIAGSTEEVDVTAKRLGARLNVEIDKKNKEKEEKQAQINTKKIQKKETTIIDVLKTELEKRNNPTDLKAHIIGKVVQLEPIIVSISDGHVLLKENDHLKISEWFRFRCNIDKTSALSNDVPSAIKNAKNVTETHSQGGSPCSMPKAIEHLATAINKINTELLALKCNLALDDHVTVASLEETDKYVLLDKIISNA